MANLRSPELLFDSRSLRRRRIETERLFSLFGLPFHKLPSEAVVWLTQLVSAFFEEVEDSLIELDVQLRRLSPGVRLLDLGDDGAAHSLDQPRAHQRMVRERPGHSRRA